MSTESYIFGGGGQYTIAYVAGGAVTITISGTAPSLTLAQSLAVSAGSTAGAFSVTSTGANQAVVKYDGSNYLTINIGATGSVTYAAVGAGAAHSFGTQAVSVGTLTASAGITATAGGLTVTAGPLIQTAVTVITYSATMATNAALGNTFSIVATDTAGMTISNPTNAASGQTITYLLKNSSGGTMGTITWGNLFKVTAITKPANGFQRSISFLYDGTNWIETNFSGVDVAV